MYYLICRYLITGGVQTLTLREGEWLKKNKGDVCIVAQITTENIVKLYKRIGIKVMILNKWTAKEIHNAVLSKNQEIKLIHMYDLGEFLRYKSHYPKHNVKLVYYCVHPTADCFLKSSNLGKKLFNRFFSKAISKYNKNKNIMYMDQETLTRNLENYCLEDEEKLFTVLPLPYKIKNNQPKDRSKDTCHILTVSRADFPYKGYMIGMLEEINQRYNEIPNIQLTIISSGEQLSELKEKINSLNPKVKEIIELIDGVTPDKLPNYYKNTDLYVGMGTTVLEAADYWIPSIMTQYDTYEFVSTGFFNENPLDLGSRYIEGSSGIEQIKHIVKLSDLEYRNMQKETKNALKKNYDEDVILEKLDKWQCSNKEKLSFFSNLFLKIYFALKYWRFR